MSWSSKTVKRMSDGRRRLTSSRRSSRLWRVRRWIWWRNCRLRRHKEFRRVFQFLLGGRRLPEISLSFQAVRDEEAVKREALVAEWKAKEAGLAAEADERIERLEKEYKEMISKLKGELETAKAEQEEGESQAGLLKAAEHGLEIQLSELREKLHQAEAEAQKQVESSNVFGLNAFLFRKTT